MPRRHPYIRRDGDHGGWVVQLMRRRRFHRAWFGDRGDREGSLRRAIAWRDSMLDALPPPRHIKLTSSRNTTGIIGVYLARSREGRTVRLRYVASWTDEHARQRSRSFSVAKYGARQARALAREARQEAIARLLRAPCADRADPALVLARTRARQRQIAAELPAPLRLHRKNVRNKSGVVGVFLLHRPGAHGASRHWTAVCHDGPGRKRARHFSVEKHGHRRARDLAIRARREMIQALRDARKAAGR